MARFSRAWKGPVACLIGLAAVLVSPEMARADLEQNKACAGKPADMITAAWARDHTYAALQAVDRTRPAPHTAEFPALEPLRAAAQAHLGAAQTNTTAAK